MHLLFTHASPAAHSSSLTQGRKNPSGYTSGTPQPAMPQAPAIKRGERIQLLAPE